MKKRKDGTVNFNCILILQSLGSFDRKTGEEIQQKIRLVCLKENIVDYQLINLVSKADLFQVFAEIWEKAKEEKFFPYIHLEMHGAADGTGLVMSNDDYVSWNEIKERIREINIVCGNNLFISLATCYGANLLKLYEFDKPCPFYGYMGAIGEINPIEAETSYSEYFEVLLTTKNFQKAVEAHSNMYPTNKYAFINCETYFEFLFDRHKEKNGDRFKLMYSRMKDLLKQSKINNKALGISGKDKRRLIERVVINFDEKNVIEEARQTFMHELIS